ncbi:GlxA family transcriptional regulator [Pseudonocardia sp. TRM90224]|uniref:GlxA family transcriptional regulator n=1 Tax=Pseudonocardia sp. TRM90224 TaxID=2812678 RepID=UPI001E602CF2|nr:helix-turn-helix domain-containing protein [Pseudonocardia sp. TRM90224]
MHVVAVLAVDHAHSFDLATPLQVFTTAHSVPVQPGAVLGEPLYRVVVCGDGEDMVVTGVGGAEMYRYTPAHRLRVALDADTIVVPGSAGHRWPSPDVIDVLREAHRRGIRIASICGGAFTLAAAGLLDGRRAATHWTDAMVIAEQFPLVEVDAGVLFVDDGDVLTSAGAASGLDLCLHMIRRDHGSAVAAETARHMVVPPQRDGGQAQFIRHRDPGVGDGSLEPTMRWMRERIDQALTSDEIAEHAGVSERTLYRWFREQTGKSPLQWILQQRLRYAQELLETTDLPIEAVAHQSGFSTSINLRQHFARHTKTSPLAYRRAFRARTG